MKGEIADSLCNTARITRREQAGESKRGGDPASESFVYPDDNKATLNGVQG